MTGTIQTVLTLPDGRAWIRLLDQEAATEEGRRAEHAVGYFYKIGVAADCMFLSLRSRGGVSLATAMLPTDPSRRLRVAGPRRMDDPQIVGPRNSDPFPSQGDAIAALGDVLGMVLGADLYTYRRSRADDDVEEECEPPFRP